MDGRLCRTVRRGVKPVAVEDQTNLRLRVYMLGMSPTPLLNPTSFPLSEVKCETRYCSGRKTSPPYSHTAARPSLYGRCRPNLSLGVAGGGGGPVLVEGGLVMKVGVGVRVGGEVGRVVDLGLEYGLEWGWRGSGERWWWW